MSSLARFTKQPSTKVVSRFTLPSGSCDCHGHIFPSPDEFPIAKPGMPLAPIDLYIQLHGDLGFDRGVLVQGGAYGHDNRAMLDALRRFPGALRGVALVPPETSEDDLAALSVDRVRALRFTGGGASRIDALPGLAPKMRDAGLHAEVFIGLDRLAELPPLDIPVVLDHLAGPFDAGQGTGQQGFRTLLQLMAERDLWVKLTPQRNSSRFPDYDDVRPFVDALIDAHPDRLVWGSDWPFPNMSDETPDLGDLVTLFGDWVTDEALRRTILVDNPARLYGY